MQYECLSVYSEVKALKMKWAFMVVLCSCKSPSKCNMTMSVCSDAMLM